MTDIVRPVIKTTMLAARRELDFKRMSSALCCRD